MDKKTALQVIKYLRKKGVRDDTIQLTIYSDNLELWRKSHAAFQDYKGRVDSLIKICSEE